MKLEHKDTLWVLTRGQRVRYGVAVGAIALANASQFGVPLVTAAAIDGVLGGDSESWLVALGRGQGIVTSTGLLWLAAGLVLISAAVAGAFQYLHGRWAALASERIVRGLRDRLYTHLSLLPCSYHDAADTGDLVQRCTSDVDTVRVFLAQHVVQIARSVLLVLIALPILLTISVPMALLSVALYPVITAFSIVYFRRIRDLFLETDRAEGKMTAVLQENLTGIRVVRAFARQDFECEKFAEKNADFRDRNLRLIRLLGSFWSISDLLCFAQIALVLFFGAAWTAAGELKLGAWVAFMACEGLMIWPVRHMGRVLADTGKAMVALGRLGEILDEPLEVVRERELLSEANASGLPRVHPEPAGLQGDVRVDRLSFSFGEEGRALHDISLHVAPGETLALIGPPGSGKSTLVQLLLKLYEYEEGLIRLDGRPLTSLSRAFVRSEIGVVLQEPFLYSRSVGANLAFGHSGATEEEIAHAARDACIHESIEDFPDGYETLVGERGVTLSGGQRQRVAIARALLKDPPILVLDDSLSAVDTETESRILSALRERRGRRTTIVIAHRLSTVRHADRIVVLDEGRVVQSGTHPELYDLDGPYRRLWRIQGALEDELAGDLVETAHGREEGT